MTYLLFIFCFYTTALFASSRNPLVYLTWQEDPTTTMTIQWLTRDKDLNDTVSYRLEERDHKSHRKWNKVNGEHRGMPQERAYVVHRVLLKNLRPDTIYKFQVGKSSNVYRFRTMPQDLKKPVRFIVGGDACNSNIDRFRSMSHRASKENPRFAIIGGDIAYAAPKSDDGDEENFGRWRGFFRCWMKEMVDKDGCLIPLFVAIGNHEVKGHFHRKPEDAPFFYAFFERAYYDFGFGNYAHFTFLDSGHTNGIDGKQKTWLKETLKAKKHFLHRFATYHVGAYPSVGHFNDTVRMHIRKNWVPLFEQYKVDACFESHDHAYKRTFPMLQGKKDEAGVVYFGDGSWGVKPRKPEKKRPYLARTEGKQQVLVVELYNDKRKFWAIDLKGRKIDRYEQTVRK